MNAIGAKQTTGSLAAFSAASALAFGRAVQVNNGAYNPDAIFWLIVAISLAASGWLIPLPRWRGVALAICLAGLVWQIQQHLHELPMAGITDPVVTFNFCTIAIPVLALGAAGAILLPKLARTVFIPLLLLAHFTTGFWLLNHSRPPFLDVYEETRDSCQGLTRGENPYAMTFPDIYAPMPAWDRMWLDAGTVGGGRTRYGYQYMPLSLEVEWAGHAAAGGFRYANLLALTLAGGLLAYARKGPLAPAAASLLLLTPRGYFVIEQGWAEPTVLLCLAIVVFLAARRSAAIPWMLGLLFVSKQYMVLTALAMPILIRGRRELTVGAIKVSAAGALVTLPLVLWNIGAFWHSAVVELAKNPFRGDALSLAALWAQSGHAPPPQWLAFAAAIGAGGFALFRAPRNATGFAAAVGLILICFFALAKQAFCNYYFLTIGALCGCIAVADVEEADAKIP